MVGCKKVQKSGAVAYISGSRPRFFTQHHAAPLFEQMELYLLVLYLVFLTAPLLFAVLVPHVEYIRNFSWWTVVMHIAWNTIGIQVVEKSSGIGPIIVGHVIPTVVTCYRLSGSPRIEVSVKIWMKSGK